MIRDQSESSKISQSQSFSAWIAALTDAFFANQLIAARASSAELHRIAKRLHEGHTAAMSARECVFLDIRLVRLDDDRVSARFPHRSA
jgi:hypothetical protein